MRTTPLWHLLFGLFVNTHCLPDWNIGTQPDDIAALESLLGNGIQNPPKALGTLIGVSLLNNGVNKLSSETTQAKDISNCVTDTERLPSKKRARRNNNCPADPLQFNRGQNGRQVLPIAPSGQQGGDGGSSGGNGSGELRVPFVRFPRHDDPLQYIFIPEMIRPRENDDLCPHLGYHVPVCARESDAYISNSPDAGDTILDPCHLYEPLMGCLFMEGEIGFCCLMTAVAYNDLSQNQLNRWQSLLRPQYDASLPLESLERELQSGLPNPFKLVGIDCIPLWKRQAETIIPETPLK